MRFLFTLACCVALSAQAQGGVAGPAPLADGEAPAAAEVDGEQLRRSLLRRARLTKAHHATGALTAITLFTAQGFGLANRIALASGVPREDLSPTLNVHRALVLTAVTSYVTTGAIALGMPGPLGPGSKFGGGRQLPRNRHAALAVGHAASLLTAGITGILQAYVARDTDAYEPLLVTHQVAAGVTAGLLLTAVFVVR